MKRITMHWILLTLIIMVKSVLISGFIDVNKFVLPIEFDKERLLLGIRMINTRNQALKQAAALRQRPTGQTHTKSQFIDHLLKSRRGTTPSVSNQGSNAHLFNNTHVESLQRLFKDNTVQRIRDTNSQKQSAQTSYFNYNHNVNIDTPVQRQSPVINGDGGAKTRLINGRMTVHSTTKGSSNTQLINGIMTILPTKASVRNITSSNGNSKAKETHGSTKGNSKSKRFNGIMTIQSHTQGITNTQKINGLMTILPTKASVRNISSSKDINKAIVTNTETKGGNNSHLINGLMTDQPRRKGNSNTQLIDGLLTRLPTKASIRNKSGSIFLNNVTQASTYKKESSNIQSINGDKYMLPNMTSTKNTTYSRDSNKAYVINIDKNRKSHTKVMDTHVDKNGRSNTGLPIMIPMPTTMPSIKHITKTKNMATLPRIIAKTVTPKYVTFPSVLAGTTIASPLDSTTYEMFNTKIPKLYFGQNEDTVTPSMETLFSDDQSTVNTYHYYGTTPASYQIQSTISNRNSGNIPFMGTSFAVTKVTKRHLTGQGRYDRTTIRNKPEPVKVRTFPLKKKMQPNMNYNEETLGATPNPNLKTLGLAPNPNLKTEVIPVKTTENTMTATTSTVFSETESTSTTTTEKPKPKQKMALFKYTTTTTTQKPKIALFKFVDKSKTTTPAVDIGLPEDPSMNISQKTETGNLLNGAGIDINLTGEYRESNLTELSQRNNDFEQNTLLNIEIDVMNTTSDFDNNYANKIQTTTSTTTQSPKSTPKVALFKYVDKTKTTLPPIDESEKYVHVSDTHFEVSPELNTNQTTEPITTNITNEAQTIINEMQSIPSTDFSDKGSTPTTTTTTATTSTTTTELPEPTPKVALFKYIDLSKTTTTTEPPVITTETGDESLILTNISFSSKLLSPTEQNLISIPTEQQKKISDTTKTTTLVSDTDATTTTTTSTSTTTELTTPPPKIQMFKYVDPSKTTTTTQPPLTTTASIDGSLNLTNESFYSDLQSSTEQILNLISKEQQKKSSDTNRTTTLISDTDATTTTTTSTSTTTEFTTPPPKIQMFKYVDPSKTTTTTTTTTTQPPLTTTLPIDESLILTNISFSPDLQLSTEQTLNSISKEQQKKSTDTNRTTTLISDTDSTTTTTTSTSTTTEFTTQPPKVQMFKYVDPSKTTTTTTTTQPPLTTTPPIDESLILTNRSFSPDLQLSTKQTFISIPTEQKKISDATTTTTLSSETDSTQSTTSTSTTTELTTPPPKISVFKYVDPSKTTTSPAPPTTTTKATPPVDDRLHTVNISPELPLTDVNQTTFSHTITSLPIEEQRNLSDSTVTETVFTDIESTPPTTLTTTTELLKPTPKIASFKYVDPSKTTTTTATTPVEESSTAKTSLLAASDLTTKLVIISVPTEEQTNLSDTTTATTLISDIDLTSPTTIQTTTELTTPAPKIPVFKYFDKSKITTTTTKATPIQNRLQSTGIRPSDSTTKQTIPYRTTEANANKNGKTETTVNVVSDTEWTLVTDEAIATTIPSTSTTELPEPTVKMASFKYVDRSKITHPPIDVESVQEVSSETNKLVPSPESPLKNSEQLTTEQIITPGAADTQTRINDMMTTSPTMITEPLSSTATIATTESPKPTKRIKTFKYLDVTKTTQPTTYERLPIIKPILEEKSEQLTQTPTTQVKEQTMTDQNRNIGIAVMHLDTEELMVSIPSKPTQKEDSSNVNIKIERLNSSRIYTGSTKIQNQNVIGQEEQDFKKAMRTEDSKTAITFSIKKKTKDVSKQNTKEQSLMSTSKGTNSLSILSNAAIPDQTVNRDITTEIKTPGVSDTAFVISTNMYKPTSKMFVLKYDDHTQPAPPILHETLRTTEGVLDIHQEQQSKVIQQTGLEQLSKEIQHTKLEQSVQTHEKPKSKQHITTGKSKVIPQKKSEQIKNTENTNYIEMQDKHLTSGFQETNTKATSSTQDTTELKAPENVGTLGIPIPTIDSQEWGSMVTLETHKIVPIVPNFKHTKMDTSLPSVDVSLRDVNSATSANQSKTTKLDTKTIQKDSQGIYKILTSIDTSRYPSINTETNTGKPNSRVLNPTIAPMDNMKISFRKAIHDMFAEVNAITKDYRPVTEDVRPLNEVITQKYDQRSRQSSSKKGISISMETLDDSGPTTQSTQAAVNRITKNNLFNHTQLAFLPTKTGNTLKVEPTENTYMASTPDNVFLLSASRQIARAPSLDGIPVSLAYMASDSIKAEYLGRLKLENEYASLERKDATGACSGCKIKNGAGYNSHPTDCDKYVQCFFDDSGLVAAFYRSCPWGQFWNQDILSCQQAKYVRCQHDPCLGIFKGTRPSQTSCRNYWQCQGHSEPMCCPEGHAYISGEGCRPDTSCHDICFSGNSTTLYECDKRSVSTDITMFEQFVAGVGWIKMICASGTKFNAEECSCSLASPRVLFPQECKSTMMLEFNDDQRDSSGNDVFVANENVDVRDGLAYFNGSARLVIPLFTNAELGSNFGFRVRYKEDKNHRLNGRMQSLVNNGDCGALGSVRLALSDRNVDFGLETTEEPSTVSISIPKKDTEWSEVVYYVSDNNLHGWVDGQSKMAPIHGSIRKTTCALQIGHGEGFQNFIGYIDEVEFFRCDSSIFDRFTINPDKNNLIMATTRSATAPTTSHLNTGIFIPMPTQSVFPLEKTTSHSTTLPTTEKQTEFPTVVPIVRPSPSPASPSTSYVPSLPSIEYQTTLPTTSFKISPVTFRPITRSTTSSWIWRTMPPIDPVTLSSWITTPKYLPTKTTTPEPLSQTAQSQPTGQTTLSTTDMMASESTISPISEASSIVSSTTSTADKTTQFRETSSESQTLDLTTTSTVTKMSEDNLTQDVNLTSQLSSTTQTISTASNEMDVHSPPSSLAPDSINLSTFSTIPKDTVTPESTTSTTELVTTNPGSLLETTVKETAKTTNDPLSLRTKRRTETTTEFLVTEQTSKLTTQIYKASTTLLPTRVAAPIPS